MRENEPNMRIASWNVNSIKARGAHVKDWLDSVKPDILMVQELKGLEFPHEEFKALGYHTEAVTQKAYNGVAIFSKEKIELKHTSLPGNEDDEQARYIEFRVNGMTFINIYLPNGNPVYADDTAGKGSSSGARSENPAEDAAFSEKYRYKLRWMDLLIARLTELRANEEPFAIGGDFNVIPEPRDVHNPQNWENDALFMLETKQKYRAMLNLGLTDAFRVRNQDDEQYTFWDYTGGAWPQNKGLRIDHFLLSPPLADRLQNCYIDSNPRGQEKPSDHTPIVIELEQ